MSEAQTDREHPTKWLTGLDGLRALAVGAVLVYHFEPSLLPGGFLGVDLFFVISGYLITRLLLAEIDNYGHLSLAEFYFRRARRLLPAVVLLIAAVTFGALYIWRDALPALRGAVPSSLGYVTNWWMINDHQSYFVATGRPSMLQHLWSLAIEEQFYLVWPIALALLIGADLRRRRVAVLTSARLLIVAGTSVVLALASTSLMALIAIHGDVPFGADSGRVYFGTDTHAMGLLLGAAAGALAVRSRFGIPRPVLRGAFLSDLAGLAAAAAVALTMWRVNEFAPGLYRGGFLGVSALCAVVVAAAPRHRSALGWLLERAPLRWIGQRSYALYLWHWPVTVVTRPELDLSAPEPAIFALRLGVTLLLADATYRLVERPIRVGGAAALLDTWRIGRLSPGTRSRLAPVGLVAGLAVVASIAAGLMPSHSPAQAGPPPQAAAARPAAVAPAAVAPVAPAPLAPAALLPPSSSPAPGPTAAAHRRPGTRPAVQHRTSAPAPAPPMSVSAFGDSVMLGASKTLRATLPHATVDAVEGRQARAVFADIAAQHKALAPYVVIHTGDNGIISSSDLSKTLNSLADRRRVVVLTDRVPRDWQGPNNRMLADVVHRFRNAVLVDWYRHSANHRDWFYSDGLHLRPVGAQAYVSLIAGKLR